MRYKYYKNKEGGDEVIRRLLQLYVKIWENGEVPQDFKDALIVHIYKRKGDRACCDNHRGISLLSIAGKVLGRVILNRLSSYVFGQNIIPESQCGFCPGRGTTDMIFTARTLLQSSLRLSGLGSPESRAAYGLFFVTLYSCHLL